MIWLWDKGKQYTLVYRTECTAFYKVNSQKGKKKIHFFIKMSELVPFFDEDEQLDDNLLRSIETLLDDNEQSLDGSKWTAMENGIGIANSASINSSRMTPQHDSYETRSIDGNSFAFGNQIYQKWSTNESGGENAPMVTPKRNYGRYANQSRSMNSMKSAKKHIQQPPNGAVSTNAMRSNAQIAQYQAILAEKANQLLNQYLQLNYEFLSAQAQILGIPLDQYIRNLLVALNNQRLTPPVSPNQPFLYATSPLSPVMSPVNPIGPVYPTMNLTNLLQQQQQQLHQQQRAFAKHHFNSNKKN